MYQLLAALLLCFLSRASCQKVDCFAPPEIGPCFGNFPSYYYDAKTGKCAEFIYGGCGGNTNRFNTLAECQEACNGNCLGLLVFNSCAPSDCNIPTCENKTPFCFQIFPCEPRCQCPRGTFLRSDGKCVKEEHCPNFNPCGRIPGGPLRRNGSIVRCGTRKCPKNYECTKGILGVCCPAGVIQPLHPVVTCATVRCKEGTKCEDGKGGAKCVPIDIDCFAPPVTGPCKARIRSYYYDARTGKCGKFIYGGCHGNSNRFDTLYECQAACYGICLPPLVFNPCGPPPECEAIPTCEDTEPVCNSPLTVCGPRCECPKGTFLRSDGKCVTKKECFNQCGIPGQPLRDSRGEIVHCRGRCRRGYYCTNDEPRVCCPFRRG